MPITRIPAPFLALVVGLARKGNIRQWLSVQPIAATRHFALAEYDSLSQKYDARRCQAGNALKKMEKL
jgi:hypothetical protein